MIIVRYAMIIFLLHARLLHSALPSSASLDKAKNTPIKQNKRSLFSPKADSEFAFSLAHIAQSKERSEKLINALQQKISKDEAVLTFLLVGPPPYIPQNTDSRFDPTMRTKVKIKAHQITIENTTLRLHRHYNHCMTISKYLNIKSQADTSKKRSPNPEEIALNSENNTNNAIITKEEVKQYHSLELNKHHEERCYCALQ